MLSKNKPGIPIGEKQKLRAKKWEHAYEVKTYFKLKGIDVHIFKSKGTPHLRIGDVLDYWPATTRFYFYNQKCWGIGFENLKKVFVKTKEEKEMDKQFKEKFLYG